MNWLYLILIVAAIGGLIGYLGSGKTEDAAAGALGAGVGCGYIILQIFIAILSIWVLLKIGSWLFS